MIGTDIDAAAPAEPAGPHQYICVLATDANVDLVIRGVLPVPDGDGIPMRPLSPRDVYLTEAEFAL